MPCSFRAAESFRLNMAFWPGLSASAHRTTSRSASREKSARPTPPVPPNQEAALSPAACSARAAFSPSARTTGPSPAP